MEPYKYLVTPFWRGKKELTSTGRTLLSAHSARQMTAYIQSGAGYKGASSRNPTTQILAEKLALDAIQLGLCMQEKGTFVGMTPDALFEAVNEWGNLPAVVKAESEGDASDEDSGEGTETRVATGVKAAEHLARKLLMSAASAEISRLKSALPGDLLISELDRANSSFESNGFTSLGRAYGATRAKQNEANRVANALRNDVLLPSTALSGAYSCIAALAELRRYVAESDWSLTLCGLPTFSEIDKRTVLLRATDGTVIQEKLAEMNRVSLMSNVAAEATDFDESVQYLDAVFRAEAAQEELVQRPGTKTAPIVVGNARSERAKGRERRESSGRNSIKVAAKPKPKTGESRTDFYDFIKSNPGDCFRCKQKGHLQKDCPSKLKNGESETRSGGAYVCLPAAYRAAPTTVSNIILDTGAAAVSYVTKDEGFDIRTRVTTDAIVSGIGNGAVSAPQGGTVYARVPATVYLPNGRKIERKEVVRFDAVLAPKLVKGGTGLLSLAGFVHDGGVNALVRKVDQQVDPDDISHPVDMCLQLGAVGALKDRTKRIEVMFKARDGLLWAPRMEFLGQSEIESLVPNPPKALKHFNAVIKGE
ncbi:Zinc finger, CCHC-type [Ostreococcus tauri]|uniref:Zinc finger, CCHC-type n=1 Tax=Ostreococcus tauri TaxID=70448 RepID=A0A090MDP3_OSTTA|nr:Zinc finger, CCHC-type [Ostreococcus tauri]CEG01051.1 Zinc finger, CCHC-type [Ostreococcus tauri]|eukprot:XP_022840767.1 Zinc finger, CCHC-type [Ostreococcus tauri]